MPWNREKIIEVFTEVQLIEAKLETISNIQERDSLAHVYYQSLWNEHQTNQQEFDQVFEYYAQRPEKMEELYAEIITRLTLMQSQQQE
ncbi:MAG: DUF4296 domain-containing protein [Bacteroidales bacterium]|nr:DUF4296 domain-containing protein [Bacteroidales bacterium]